MRTIGDVVRLGRVTLVYMGKGRDGEDIWSSDIWQVLQQVLRDFPARVKQ